jgi:streptogramin lyase
MDQQMSAADWLLNLPKETASGQVEGCVGCHFETVRKFRFDEESWLKIVRVMRGAKGNLLYQNWGMPQHAQTKGAKPVTELPDWEPTNKTLAAYLAKVRGPVPFDMSAAKILPRQKGRATHVLYTEYDVPYDSAEPHDTGVSSDGIVFWGDWRWGRIGRLDPSTGAMKYWDVPQSPEKPPMHPGVFQIVFDKDDNVWTDLVWQGGLVKLDRKTESLSTWMFPDMGPRRIIMASSDKKRGRIWFETDDYYGHWDMAYYQQAVDKLAVFHLPYRPGADQSFIYGHVLDSQGNAYALKAVDSDIDRIDAETEKLTRYSTPTPNAFPRRGDYDNQDRIWFSEYNVGQVGMLDPKTGKITEYKMPTPMSKAYSTNVDRRTGLVWSAEFLADRFNVLDPKTGEMRDYLLPSRDSQVRIISNYSVGDHTVLYFGVMGKYGGGKIGKLEAW